MPPIGRGRAKVGLRRIDAAYDALVPLGFSKDVVRRTINKLLKVYGGENGWIFVEEGSYRMVIETILDEQDRERTVCEKDMTNGQETEANTINDRGMESAIVNDGNEEEVETREETGEAHAKVMDIGFSLSKSLNCQAELFNCFKRVSFFLNLLERGRGPCASCNQTKAC